jgi:ADP-ribose pyrophosphatase
MGRGVERNDRGADVELPNASNERVVYDGRIFQAVVARVRLPHRDQVSEVEIVRHAPSVGIAAMPAPGTILLVRQYRYAAGGFVWELPAGSVDDGEEAEAAARRETQEELGVIASHLERLGELVALPGYCTEAMTFFKATDLREPGPGDPAAHQDADESIEVQAFRLDEVRQMILDGEIRDMKTAAVLPLLDAAAARRGDS